MTGPGFTQGDDFVAARVSIDVPTEGLQSLKEMSNGINNFRTSVEAATRSSANFVSYINQMVQAGNMATEAHRNLAQQLERTADLQQRSMGGGVGGNAQAMLPVSRLAPQGFVDNFAGMGVGMGSGRMPTTPQGITPGNYQSGTIDPTRQLDPRAYINAQAGRYRVLGSDFGPSTTGAPNMHEAANRIEARDKQQRQQLDNNPGVDNLAGGPRFGGLARNIMSEMAVGGGSIGGMLGLAQKGLGAVGGALGRASGAAAGGGAGPTTAILANAGGAASAMARMAGGVGLSLVGLEAVEKGGAMYQGFNRLGMIRGGGAEQGFGTEMQMRTMALNPFLSTEQSRQIVMAGLTEGYSGKTFDTVTDFMANNLKNMNIQVSDSVAMLRKNVNEGGESVTGLATSLAYLKDLAKPGNSSMSLQDLTQQFQQGTSSLINNGVPGTAASQIMNEALGGWGNNMALKGQFGQMVSTAGSTAQGGALLEQFSGIRVPGLRPDMVGAFLGQHGGMNGQAVQQALQKAVAQLFKNYPVDSVQFLNNVPIFQQIIGSISPGNKAATDTTDAINMIESIRNGDRPNDEGKKKWQDYAQTVTKGRSTSEMLTGTNSNVGELFGALGRGATDLFKGGVAWLTGNKTADDNARLDFGKTFDNLDYHATAQARNPILDSIINQYGASSIQVVDKSGKASDIDGSRAQTQGLADGTLKWKRKGDSGNGIPLAQTPQDLNKDYHTGSAFQGAPSQTHVSFQPAQVQITFGPNGQMTASPNPIQLTPNQQAANAGVGDASHNNPPPGDGYGYRPNQSVGSH